MQDLHMQCMLCCEEPNGKMSLQMHCVLFQIASNDVILGCKWLRVVVVDSIQWYSLWLQV